MANLVFLQLLLLSFITSNSTLLGPFVRNYPPIYHPALTLNQADKDLDQFFRLNYRQLNNSTLFVNRNHNNNYLFIYRLNNNGSLFVFDSDFDTKTKIIKINGVL